MARRRIFYEALIRLWPLSRFIYWLSNRRLMRPLSAPFFAALRSEAIIIPVHETVADPESVILPYPLLIPLIEETRTRLLMTECMCRRGDDCRAYPRDVGCLFLGDGSFRISPSMGRFVDRDEARAHVQRAMTLGLVPLVVHTTFDALALGIPYRRMLGICFCCQCCCTVQQGLRLGPPAFWDVVVRLPGLSVEINGGCSGCGACADACYVRAISMSNGRARIDGGLCKGCGRCSTTCPDDAITLSAEDGVDMVEQLTERIARRTDIGLRGPHAAQGIECTDAR